MASTEGTAERFGPDDPHAEPLSVLEETDPRSAPMPAEAVAVGVVLSLVGLWQVSELVVSLVRGWPAFEAELWLAAAALGPGLLLRNRDARAASVAFLWLTALAAPAVGLWLYFTGGSFAVVAYGEELATLSPPRPLAAAAAGVCLLSLAGLWALHRPAVRAAYGVDGDDYDTQVDAWGSNRGNDRDRAVILITLVSILLGAALIYEFMSKAKDMP